MPSNHGPDGRAARGGVGGGERYLSAKFAALLGSFRQNQILIVALIITLNG
jgi:hypothetical protein